MFKLLTLLAIKTLLLIGVILHAGIHLGPDEAQYWTWSRDLDWGYYSKPPGIAWQIGLGTFFLGDTELGVRAGALVVGILLPLLVFWLARACRLQPKTCFWAGATMALCPMGVLSSFLAITDGGMILFWTAACIYLADALEKKYSPSYRLLGLFILGGALFKWPIYILWIFVAFFFPSWRILVGVTISLLGLLPSVIWNSANNWATFRHVLATLFGGHARVLEKTAAASHGNFLEFTGAQAVLLSPIPFLFLLFTLWFVLRHRNTLSPSLRFCAWVSFSILGFYALCAFFMKIQGNWCVFAYPTAIVLLCWYACEKLPKGQEALAAGLLLSAALCAFAFFLPYIQSQNLFPRHPIPYRVNPFRHNLGWVKMKEELKAAGYDPAKHFLFGDKYQMSSLLSFYSEGQKRAYFLNLHGIRRNQFSFWPSMADEQIGRDGYFVLAENIPHLHRDFPKQMEQYQKWLEPYFKTVQYLGLKTLFMANGEVAKGALIFKCNEYNGKKPLDSDLY